jgi:hypothetical protein
MMAPLSCGGDGINVGVGASTIGSSNGLSNGRGEVNTSTAFVGVESTVRVAVPELLQPDSPTTKRTRTMVLKRFMYISNNMHSKATEESVAFENRVY